ncbi:hypothetical protein KSP40_PGU008203 [Platanthera guangdongensis]|uniref:Uncharacterized protein n=1 Tax=Platanthera guangdongensis TaxID=2320717 RepID=A0ABR2MF25_9ASPA
MFSQVVATGDLAWAPSSRNLEHESVDERDMSDDGDSQIVEDLSPNATGMRVDTTSSRPSSSSEGRKKTKEKGKKKIVGRKRAMSSTMEDIAETSRIIGRVMQEPPKIQISSALFTIPEAIKELEKYPEIMGVFDFYDYCTLFLRDKSNRDTFLSIPEELKVKWLKARHTQKTQ